MNSDVVPSTTSSNERVKPYSIQRPALKTKAPMSGLSTTLMSKPAADRPSSQATKECGPSPKRRRIDTTPERASPLIIPSNKTRQGVITSSNTRPRPVSLSLPSSSPRAPEQRANEHHVIPADKLPYPLTPPRPLILKIGATTPVQVKHEPESPPLLAVERKAVTGQYQFYPFPENCKKKHPEWDINRITFQKEKIRVLKEKGFKLIGKCITRDDGISLQWKASFPVWNDTLKQVSLHEDLDEGGTDTFSLEKVVDEPQSPDIVVLSRLPSPASTAPAPPEPNSREPSRMSASLLNSPSVTSVPPRPSGRPNPKRKRKSEHIPRGEMNLATAIELSQRDNASPGVPWRGTTSPSTRDSPAIRTFSSLSPSVPYPWTAIFPTSPTKRSVPSSHSKSKGPLLQIFKSMQEETYPADGEEDLDEEEDISITRRESRVLEDASGWTVIKEVTYPGQSDKVEDNREEGNDQLSSDEDEDELREAAEAISIGGNDENGDERNEVEGEAIPSGVPSAAPKATTDVAPPAVIPAANENTTANTDIDDLSCEFLTKYMQLYETDRDSLVFAYASDAKLVYRIFEHSQSTSPTSERSPHHMLQTRDASFPLHTARGHDEISSCLHVLIRTHFSQTLDKDGNKKVDVEYWSEQSGLDIWLYVRSIMIIDDAEDSITTGQDMRNQIRKWTVDHNFLLRRTEIGSAKESGVAKKDDWPVLVRMHQMLMHELPL
ncbi:hypothetical protein AX15_002225 [Amanita polypyramis BW_CC]|nr:hypothetical protein AX15_002225 [Amanita polypyramis BW_CC]